MPHPVYLPPSQLPHAYGEPGVSATVKARFEDFRVDENLGFELDGAGQHLWLYVQKRNRTTDDVAKCLAQAAGVKLRDVGYAGLKDRHALTTQWFSVDVGVRSEPDWEGVLCEDCRILETTRHSRKLRRGALSGNSFDITLRDVSGTVEEIATRAGRICQNGAPNYFGEQRFGRDAGNVEPAFRLLRGEQVVRNRHLRGLYYSCARSLLFNRVLAARVARANWDQPVAGDVMMLDGTRSRFSVSQPDETLIERARHLDIHPTGPLWGIGDSMLGGEAAQLETEVLAEFPDWCEGLENAGLKHDRRALRVPVPDLTIDRLARGVTRVRFSLPPGAYATTVLREVVRFSTARTSRRCHHPSDGPS